MYDHSSKIGNRGDLIKHFALTIAAREMAEGADSFTYLDVHSGRSQYDLPPTGDWKRGIGQFAQYCRDERLLSEELKCFCKVQSVADVPETRRYAGSSRIIWNVLEDMGVSRAQATLCDTNPDVCNDLKNSFRGTSSVAVCCTDGYRKAQEVDAVDLVFIDPPDIQEHYTPFLGLIRHCLSRGKPFISWNPLHGNVPKQTMSRNCLSVHELARKERIPSVTARWTKGWSGQMCGCQMLFSIPQGNKVTESCMALVDLMGWKHIQEEPERRMNQ